MSNKYSCVVYFPNGQKLFFKYVQNIYKLHLWLHSKNRGDYKYINVYNRKSKIFIVRYYNGNYINGTP